MMVLKTVNPQEYNSNLYAQYRPSYPQELINFITSQCKHTHLAWDCCTGTGIVANPLAAIFTKVIATDISAAQINQAILMPNIEYKVENLSESNFPSNSIDLITVAQGFHWLNPELFYAKANKALKAEGIIAIWCYNIYCLNPEVHSVTKRFINIIMQSLESVDIQTFNYIDSIVENGYADFKFPFKTHQKTRFPMIRKWALSHYIGYLESISSSVAYIRKYGTSPISFIQNELENIWGNRETLDLTWEIFLHVLKK